jgi:hypothetical protein
MAEPLMPFAPVTMIESFLPSYSGKVGRPWKMPLETTVCEAMLSNLQKQHMAEQDANIQGDCLNMSECGIYENGASMVPLRTLMINCRKKAMKLTWISGYSVLGCISDQSQPNLSIGRYERTNHSAKNVAGYVSVSQDRLGGWARADLLVSGGGEEIAVLGQWFVYPMAVCE